MDLLMVAVAMNFTLLQWQLPSASVMAKDRRRSGQANRGLQAGMAGTLCSRYQRTASNQPVDDIEGTGWKTNIA
ncbi:hypothetical protein [Methylobacter sp.]|jgi:hypothetical protein|uniref:hypothetical protein n=1 Tax=Methylobacter sp. TaxID=2051955 RepID=UPI003DA3DA9B